MQNFYYSPFRQFVHGTNIFYYYRMFQLRYINANSTLWCHNWLQGSLKAMSHKLEFYKKNGQPFKWHPELLAKSRVKSVFLCSIVRQHIMLSWHRHIWSLHAICFQFRAFELGLEKMYTFEQYLRYLPCRAPAVTDSNSTMPKLYNTIDTLII